MRNNVHPVLAGEGGECLINGLFLGTGDQHLDNYMHVEHASPHCGSHQFYNGILDGHAHGVFHGRIVVHKDAQKTDAKQTNRNLLLSDDAQIDTKPQLEIYADDVKCTHGATIGQIEENALFYLRSRGIAMRIQRARCSCWLSRTSAWIACSRPARSANMSNASDPAALLFLERARSIFRRGVAGRQALGGNWMSTVVHDVATAIKRCSYAVRCARKFARTFPS